MLPRLRALAGLLAAALVLAAGCSRQAASPASGPGAAAVKGGGQAGQDRAGGILYRPILYGDPNTLDPILSNYPSSITVQLNIFNRLVKNGEGGKIVGDAAESWTVSPDGKTLTFKLRKGLKFHHNLREAKAADWKYSFERGLDKKWNAWSFAKLLPVEGAEEFRQGQAPDVKGLKVIDDYTLQISLKEPDSVFLQSLTENWAAVVPKDYIDQVQRDFGLKPVGTGPFKFRAYKKDDYVAVERFQDYHLGPALLDGQVFRVMNEANTRQAEFLSGNIDFTVLTDAQYRQFSNDDKWKKHLIEVPEPFTRTVAFNVTKKPFDSVQVRQAFNFAIDKKALIEKVLYNKAFLPSGPLPSSLYGFNKDLQGYPYDPQRAKQLLADAGYSNGFEFELIFAPHPVVGSTLADALSQYLTPLGIKIKPRQLEGAAFVKALQEGNFQAAGASFGGDLDAVGYLWRRFHSKSQGVPGNYSRYTNDQVDRLLGEARRTMDEAKRLSLARQAEKIVLDEAPWFIYHYNKAVLLHQPWVHGLRPVPLDLDYQDMHGVWIDKERRRSNWP